MNNNEKVKNLIGSESRDLFRYWHKNMDTFHGIKKYSYIKNWMACDGDLFLFRMGRGKPIAYLDYQREMESGKFTSLEIDFYDWLLEIKIPVFAIVGTIPDWLQRIVRNQKKMLITQDNQHLPQFRVYKYEKGGKIYPISSNYIKWEGKFRRKTKYKK